MGAVTRAMEPSAPPQRGTVEGWLQGLRTIASIVLGSRFPTMIPTMNGACLPAPTLTNKGSSLYGYGR